MQINNKKSHLESLQGIATQSFAADSAKEDEENYNPMSS